MAHYGRPYEHGNKAFIQMEINVVYVGKRQTQKLTGTGDNGNVTQQAEDLWTEEGAIPNIEEFVEKNL